MSDIFWRKVDPKANYQTLNARLNGLPDYLRKQQIAAPAATPGKRSLEELGAVPGATRKAIISSFPRIAKLLGADQQEVAEALAWAKEHDAAQQEAGMQVIENKPVYGNIVSGTSGAVRGATMGATDAVAKALGTKGQLDKIAAKYPTANTIGNIGGSVASAIATPGAGQLAAAKGGVLAGKTLLPTLARAGLNAATFAVPTAVFQGLASGDKNKTLSDFGSNMLWGTIGGAAAEKLFAAIPKLARAAKKVSDDLIISSAEVNAKGLREVAAGGRLGKRGVTAKHISDLKDALADMLVKNKLVGEGKEVIEGFVKGHGKLWDVVDDAFRKSGAKPSQFLNEILSDSRIQTLLNDPQYGQSVGTYILNTLQRGDAAVDLASKTSKVNPLYEIRKMLTDTITRGFSQGADDVTRLSSDAADAIKDIIDAKYIPAELKAAWPSLKLLEKATMRSEAGVAKAIVANSATAPRLMLKRMLEGAGGGTAVGAVAGAKDVDPRDPSTWLPALAKMGVYTVGGALLNTAFAKLGNKLTGKAAGAIRDLIPAISPAAAGKFEALGSKVGAGVAKALGTGAIAEKEAPQVSEAASTQAEQSAAQQEASAPPEAVQEARNQVNQKYRDVLAAKMHDIYNSTFAQYAASGLTYEVFEALLSQALGGLDDPKKTAKILIDDKAERAQFLADYDAALMFQSMNLDTALGYYTPHGPFGMGSPSEEEKMASEDLVDYMSTVAGGGKHVDEVRRKRIDARLKTIANYKVSAAQKRKLIEQTLARYGLDFDRLSSLGLYGGANG